MSQNQSQLWAKMGMSFKKYHKCQRKMGQLWAERNLGFKQYHKGQAWVLNNTTKAQRMGPVWAKIWATYGLKWEPTMGRNESQLWTEMDNLASFDFFFLHTFPFFFYSTPCIVHSVRIQLYFWSTKNKTCIGVSFPTFFEFKTYTTSRWHLKRL
jgi:hypothetical protein